MEIGHLAYQTKEMNAIYDEAQRLRKEAMRTSFSTFFAALRDVFSGGRRVAQ